MVTSTGQNDTGMFDLNLRDERYLTFEGHGAISEWKIEINKDFKTFDVQTISDVILHVRFTARQGGKVLASKVTTQLNANFANIIKTQTNGTGFFKMISMKTDFPTEFHRLIHSPAAPHAVDITIGAQHLPYWLSTTNLEFDAGANVQTMFIKPKKDQVINVNTLNIKLNGQTVQFVPPESVGTLKKGIVTQSGALFGIWSIDTGATALDPTKIDDVILLIKYQIV
jgi:hypothetical protein